MNKRVRIDKEVILKLWVLAGGRCEICNKLIWRDELTWDEANFANIAHIIAASPDGPRGDKSLSPKLQKDFSNLMLICSQHHDLFDKLKFVKKYSVEVLKEIKRNPEERIFRLNNMRPGRETTIIRLRSLIRGDTVEIPKDQIDKAVLECANRYPRYLFLDKDIDIDLTKLTEGSKSYWAAGKDKIQEIMKNLYVPGIEEETIKHISVFALARIPFLIYLGTLLSDKIPTDIYQKHRDSSEGWVWKTRKNSIKFSFRKVKKSKVNLKVTLLLSISGKIDMNKLPPDITKSTTIYELIPNNREPSRNLIETSGDLEQFRKVYEQGLRKIERHHPAVKLCLFPAIPVSIAITCGREQLKRISSTLLVYDMGDNGKYNFTMEVK